jgi:hypothetical protein
LITSEIRLRTAEVLYQESHARSFGYLWCLGRKFQLDAGPREKFIGIYLRKLGPRLYCRLGNTAMASLPVKAVRQLTILDVTATHILVDPKTAQTSMPSLYRMSTVHLPYSDGIRVEHAYPITLWDRTDNLYMTARFYGWTLHPVVLALYLRVYDFPVVLLCDYTVEPPVLKAFLRKDKPLQFANIFQERHREEGMSWADLYLQDPDMYTLDSTVFIHQGPTSIRMRFGLEAKNVHVLSKKTLTRSITVSMVHFPTWVNGPSN